MIKFINSSTHTVNIDKFHSILDEMIVNVNEDDFKVALKIEREGEKRTMNKAEVDFLKSIYGLIEIVDNEELFEWHTYFVDDLIDEMELNHLFAVIVEHSFNQGNAFVYSFEGDEKSPIIFIKTY